MDRQLDTRRHTRWQVAGFRRYLWLLPLLVVIAVTGVAVRWLAETLEGRSLAHVREAGAPGGERVGDETAVGTSGRDGTPTPVAPATGSPGAITELDTIAGSVDPLALVGRRVELHVPVQESGNPVTFWIGSPGDRMLVVLERDVHDKRAQTEGLPSSHGIVPVREGQVASIEGRIMRVPRQEERDSWGLTRAEREEVERKGVYLSAISVRSNGHAGL